MEVSVLYNVQCICIYLQVVEEERIYACIRESRALLLDIDVIRCRCGKSFESKDKIQDHIISVHYKAR